ncbi:MAG: hypothetical protein UY18_C0010G0026 [Microgenomates group bacterium GW2011_GWF2_47_9]|nr:MAG: hypothetical protein UY18_C0010G0026 [Microgenomates group bacterium GW2011_GWF2_47_9]
MMVEMTDKIDPNLMQAGEEAFWDEFDSVERGERYIVVDTKKNEVIASNARLIKRKKRTKV